MASFRYRFYKQFFLVTSGLLISMATVYKTGPAAIYRSTQHYLEHLLRQDGVSGERRAAWPGDGAVTSGTEFLQRRRSVRSACSRRNNLEGLGQVGSVLADDKSGLVYCLVPKAGCTYWKRLLESLHRQVGKNGSRDDFDIPREVIHQLPTSQGTQYDERVHGPDHYPTRVLVYRDPFDRLLASYLDKFYLPDFWEDYGQTFMEMVQGIDQPKVDSPKVDSPKEKNGAGKNRTCKWSQPDPVSAGDFMRRHFVEIKSKFGEQQTRDSACGKYLTFTEFLVSSMYDPEPHWRPLHQLCDPCKFQPTHVINMETFTQDTRHLLQTRGIRDFLAQSGAEQVSEEMHMLVEYHFSRVSHSVFLSSCLTPRELAYRLWHCFLWKGYIPPSSSYTLPDVSSLGEVKTDLLGQLRRARARGQDEADQRTWRDRYKSRFFMDVRAEIWLELFHKFQIDLDIFGWSQFEKDVLNCIV